MKICRLTLLLLFSCATLVAAADRQIAFDRDDAVWVANLDGSNARKIADGIFPAISPDAKRVAFPTVEKFGTTYMRHIDVIDVASG
jgi:TolB protein